MTVSRTLTISIVTAFAALWSIAGMAAPQLRAPIVVEGPELTLGDIFEGAGDAASIRVGPAPQPGERSVLRPGALARFAREHGLQWSPGPAVNVVVVRRASTTLDVYDVKVALRQELKNNGLSGQFDLDLRGRAHSVALPVGSPFDLAIERMTYDRESGRFNAVMRVWGPEFATREVTLDGTAHALLEVPVLTRTVSKGDIVGEGDVTWLEVRENEVRHSIVRDLDDLVGLEAKRRLRADVPIRRNDLWSPRLVRKGELVTITVQTKYMLLQTSGQALEDGARDEVIRVMNLKSRKTIQGVVSGDGAVDIPFTTASQLATN